MKGVCVVGLGYVGLPLGQLFIKKGYETHGIDTSHSRIHEISKVIPGFNTLSESYKFLDKADVVIICVPTPVNSDRTPNLNIINQCLRDVGLHVRSGQLIIIESTVYPGYCNDVAVPIIEETSGLKIGQDIYLAHCPERINPGDEKWNVANIPRVIGGFDNQSLSKAIACYKSILDTNIVPMRNIVEAEAVKIVENTFRDINIAFVNELAMSFSETGIDVINVINGASTKPFGYMAHYPSIGVGGHCIPVDPYYLIDSAKNRGYDHRFLSLAREINNGMVSFLFNKLEHVIEQKNLNRTHLKICVLGAAYKPNISDTRESPGIRFAKYASEHGIETRIYDPHVPTKSAFNSMKEALDWCNIAVLATAHDEFKAVSTKLLLERNVHTIIDGQNMLQNEHNNSITYIGVGK